MKRRDLLTGEPFFAQRINQKFKCPENRIKYYNQKATKIRHSVSHINTPLHLNLKILNELMVDALSKKFHRQFLLGKGINFNVLTHYKKIDNKETPCIYHYGIKPTDSEYVIIINTKKK